MGYVLYADIWFLTNFTMDSIALFAAGKVMGEPIRLGRLCISSLVGTLASMFLFFQLTDETLYQLCVHFLVNPLMVWMCWQSRGKKAFLAQWSVTYLSYILLGGLLEWGMEHGAGIGQLFLCLLGAALFLAVPFHMLKYIKREKETIYDLLLVTREGNLSVKGFYDTGNLLVDPLGGRPVHIIRKQILWEQIEKEGLPVRLVPFHSLGQESGLLKAVTLEGMYILREGHPLYLKKPVFGMAEETLFQDGRCDVILNGKSMEN